MAIYQKIDGVWTQAQRVYVKRNGIWVASDEAWIKQGGTWVQSYEFDVTPPDPPEITLTIVEDTTTIKGVKTLTTRYINVGVRLPGTSNDTDARLVRVLTNYPGDAEKAPTTQFGGTFTSASDQTFQTEPWSEWRYNSYGVHKDSSVVITKQWPRNAASGTVVKSDWTYYFTGWTLDDSGNWSNGTQASIHIPKSGINMPNVVTKEARFQANNSGSWRSTGFQGGDLIQQKSPRSVGLWFYGNQITESMGATGAITIRNAQIFIKREDDNGQANANIYLFWTNIGTVSALPAPGGSLGKTNITKLGTLAKGQGKWFDLPDSFHADLNKNIKSMGLDWKDPVKADAFPADFSDITSSASNLRCGELHVVWEEDL